MDGRPDIQPENTCSFNDAGNQELTKPDTSTDRLLDLRCTLPMTVCPCLTKSGVCRRHRTWYQCVSGCVGAVDSHTDVLTHSHSSKIHILWMTYDYCLSCHIQAACTEQQHKHTKHKTHKHECMNYAFRFTFYYASAADCCRRHEAGRMSRCVWLSVRSFVT